MKVVKIEDLEGVKFTGGHSFRAVLANDFMGFAVMKTVIPKGGPYLWHYPRHVEACYCIAGEGILTDVESGTAHQIKVDTVYVLDKHERHTFEAVTDTVLISIFNPPLIGTEKHDENGQY